MSTRYVWKRATVTTTVSKKTVAPSNLNYYTYEISSANNCVSAGMFYCDDYEWVGRWSPINNTQAINNFISTTIPSGKYFYFGGGWDITIPTSSTVNSADPLDFWKEDDEDYNAADSIITPLFYAKTTCTIIFPNSAWMDENQWFELESGTLHVAVADRTTSTGSFNTVLSSNSRYTYTDDGTSGSYYYKYQGSDNIDPSAISITNSTITSGSNATIKVTPRTNSYNTTSYVYQYSANGGSWVTITTSSATSYNFTVPTGTTSVQVRVQAKDNSGFTSTDYVTSSIYSVSNYKAYTSVSGAIKGINPVVAAGGGSTFCSPCNRQRWSCQDVVIYSLDMYPVVIILSLLERRKYNGYKI